MSSKKERQEENARRSRSVYYARQADERKKEEEAADRRLNQAVGSARKFARDMFFIYEAEGDDSPKLIIVDAEWTTFKESLPSKEKIAAILAYRAEMSYWMH